MEPSQYFIVKITDGKMEIVKQLPDCEGNSLKAMKTFDGYALLEPDCHLCRTIKGSPFGKANSR